MAKHYGETLWRDWRSICTINFQCLRPHITRKYYYSINLDINPLDDTGLLFEGNFPFRGNVSLLDKRKVISNRS